jgi:hypothetical protein
MDAHKFGEFILDMAECIQITGKDWMRTTLETYSS